MSRRVRRVGIRRNYGPYEPCEPYGPYEPYDPYVPYGPIRSLRPLRTMRSGGAEFIRLAAVGFLGGRRVRMGRRGRNYDTGTSGS